MRTVYLSGPMTGLPEFNYPAFHNAAQRWREAGWTVLSPAELDIQEGEALTWAEYLRRDLRLLLDCDAIAMLPGWEDSKGAALERHVAATLGLAVLDAAALP